MYDRILFPTDGSEAAASALEHVLDLAADAGATVHLLNVADTTRESVTVIRGEVVDHLVEEGERIVGAAADRAADRGVPTVTEVPQGHPARTIVAYAREHDVDLVAMATHGRQGVEQHVIGSVTERVVRTAPVPVLTVRGDGDQAPRYPYRTVLVPVDGSDCADAALAAAVDVAAATGAAVRVLHVVDTTGLGVDVRSVVSTRRLEEAADGILADAVETVEDSPVTSVSGAVEYGPTARTIRSVAVDEGADLVVMGTHGRTGVDRYLIGSVAEKLVRSSPVPVLTVRGPDD